MNVHKRCQKNVANNCGINPKQIALLLKELKISDQNQNTQTQVTGATGTKTTKAV